MCKMLMPISYKCFSIISSIGLKQKIGIDVNEVISIQIQHGEVPIFAKYLKNTLVFGHFGLYLTMIHCNMHNSNIKDVAIKDFKL